MKYRVKDICEILLRPLEIEEDGFLPSRNGDKCWVHYFPQRQSEPAKRGDIIPCRKQRSSVQLRGRKTDIHALLGLLKANSRT